MAPVGNTTPGPLGAREREVPSFLQSLDLEVSTLERVVNDLEMRLEPAVVPLAPSTTGSLVDPNKQRAPQTPLTTSLDSLLHRNRVARSRLESLLERLEL